VLRAALFEAKDRWAINDPTLVLITLLIVVVSP